GLSHLASISDFLDDSVCGILIHEKLSQRDVAISGLCERAGDANIYTLISLAELSAGELNEEDRDLYEKWLFGTLSDPRVHYLAARSHVNSAFNNSIAIEKILVNSIHIIRETKPTRLISSSTPHSVEAWVFAKCFELMPLPV